MKILNFGSCNIDYVYSLERFVEPGETLSANGMSIFPGGKGLNQSIAASNAGAEVYHAGKIGKDGIFLKELLESKGVKTDCLKISDKSTGNAIIEVVPDGENRIIIYPGANRDIDKKFADEVLSNFGKGDIIVLQNEISCRDYIMEAAAKKGMTVVFNPAPFSSDITLKKLKNVSYLILNQTESFGLTGENSVDKIIEKLREALPDTKVVITLGKNGCCYFDKSTVIRQNSYKVDAVDTTAAGDTFIGFFVAGIAQNKKEAEILKISSCASAICVTKPGAAVSIPTACDVAASIKYLKENKPSDDFKEKLKEYCLENLADASLDRFAKIMKYTPSYMTRKIKASVGISFTEYLQNLRCEKAEKMLSETDLPIGEIVQKCGYNNESHFRKLFIKRYNAKPLEYRKSKRENNYEH